MGEGRQADSHPRGIPLHHEVIVIGTGFGGSVAACRLAQAGFRPLILERGRRYEKDDFPALPAGGSLLPDLRRWSWQREQGLWDVLDLGEIISLQAAGYGGGSLVYANVHLRPPAAVFDGRWPEEYQGRKPLDDYYDLAGYMLDAAPIGRTVTPAEEPIPFPTKTRQLEQVAKLLGRDDEFFHPPLTISRKEGSNEHGRWQRACVQCGKCCSGCPEQAKNTLDFNYLAEAERPDHGAYVMTQCEVVDLESRAGEERPWLVHCVDHLAAQKCTFSARYVFLCAGSLHTTRLMSRLHAGKDDSSVGAGYWAGGGAVGVVHETTHEPYPSEGPTITTTLVHWDVVERASFFMIQDGGYARELERLIGMFRAPLWVGRNRVTSIGESAIEPDFGYRPPSTSLVTVSPALPSPVDALLDASSGGAFRDVVPPRLRSAVTPFLQELRRPMLLPQIVERTIGLSVERIIAHKWPWRWFKRWSWSARLAKCLLRRMASYYGTREQLADQALRALLTASARPRDEVASDVLGYDAERAEHRMMLLAMGRDAAPGSLHYDLKSERLIADLDLFHLGPRYAEQEQLMADIAKKLGGELRTNPAWSFLGKPITVHNQGGCPMSDDARPNEPRQNGDRYHGVTRPSGEVRGENGLYILDGSILPTSVGVNPSATIAAIAERNILRFIQRNTQFPNWPEGDGALGARRYRKHLAGRDRWKQAAQHWHLEPPRPPPKTGKSAGIESRPLGIQLKEELHGYCAPTDHMPEGDAAYRLLETRGRPNHPIALRLDLVIPNLAVFVEDFTHEVLLRGEVDVSLSGHESDYRTHPVRGRLQLFVQRFKPYRIREEQKNKRAVQERLAGPYRTHSGGPRRRQQRRMRYFLNFTERPEWHLCGYKRIRDDPGLDAWRDTTSLFVALIASNTAESPAVRAAGVAHVDLPGFLFGQIRSLTVGHASADNPFDFRPTEDHAQAVWATAKFATFFFGSLQRVYLPEARSVFETLFAAEPSNLRRDPPYPG